MSQGEHWGALSRQWGRGPCGEASGCHGTVRRPQGEAGEERGPMEGRAVGEGPGEAAGGRRFSAEVALRAADCRGRTGPQGQVGGRSGWGLGCVV